MRFSAENEERASGGDALNRNRLGDDIPAHRVVNVRGILSGAAAFDTADMQKLLLENEGIEVSFTPDGWQVDLKKDGWHNTMEKHCASRKYLKRRIYKACRGIRT